MVRVEWAQPAVGDLKEVHDYIARDSRRYAQLTVEKITAAARRLSQFPHLGEVLPEFPERDYQQLVVGMYRLIYREDPKHDRVLVVGVIHGSRDFPSAFHDR